MAEKPILGVLGGSGVYQIRGLSQTSQVYPKTPFGFPSDEIIRGFLGETEVLFLSRHGRGHARDPSHIPYRANIFALKELGVTHLLSITAVGSMREGMKPGELVTVSQFFDHTKSRIPSFFGDGLVAHVSMADPVCEQFRSLLWQASRKAGNITHESGTLLCMEGPPFSTRAESLIYRQWGVDLIGMTIVPEAKLALEAELCFAALALVTDFDCWHQEHDDVTAEAVGKMVLANAGRAQETLPQLASLLAEAGARDCGCATALKGAILTNPRDIPLSMRWDDDMSMYNRYRQLRKDLAPLGLDRYLPPIVKEDRE